MTGWYQAFLLAVMVLWLFASPRDRMALRFVLIASIASEFVKYGITIHIAGAWKLVFPATVEMGTIVAMLLWSPNRTGYMQSACIFVAWLAHVLCYLDVQHGTNFIYGNYVLVIQLVAVAQLLGFHDTVRHNLARLAHLLAGWRIHRSHGLRTASVRSAILPDSRSPHLQK